MKNAKWLVVVSIVIAGLALAVLCGGIDPAAAAEPAAALTGRVTSAEEGAMEGVVVSAKKAGATVRISVVSDAQGRFSFPQAKLEPGRYSLRIRATGYDLDEPGPVEVAASKAVSVELKLRKVQDITPQMTNAEWIASFPGSAEQKKFLYGCVGCHTLERIAKSKHDAAGFMQVMKRMASYANNSHAERPQVRVVARDPMRDFGPDSDRQAAYLASLNQSSGAWSYPLRTLPRVTGKGTRVVVTEYELPRRPLLPHDVIVDRDGIVWFSQFDQQFLGKLDPKTLKLTEFAIPVQRPGFPTGTLDLEVDPEGNLWLSHMFQSGIVKFDKKTEKFQAFPLPPGVVDENSQQSMVGPQRWTVDNKVWLNDAGIPGMHRLDMATGKFETWKPYANMKGPHSVYGIYADSKNNIFFMDFGGENVGRIDAKTGKLTLYPTPTPRSRPRRGRMDGEDRVWFAEWRAEKIGMFDTRTEKFREWPVPTPYTAPYDVVLDRTGKVWTAGMNTDRVLRMDLETGDFTEYPLPSQTNIRRVFVDDSTTPPTFWVGNNHHATIVKLEPLE
jgi:streptogramin lyase